MQTSMSLITACRENRYPSQGVFSDYFGRCTTKTEVDIVRDVYKDLIFQKGVEEKLLRNCFQSNRLERAGSYKKQTCTKSRLHPLSFEGPRLDNAHLLGSAS
jgi:hypothetical protein